MVEFPPPPRSLPPLSLLPVLSYASQREQLPWRARWLEDADPLPRTSRRTVSWHVGLSQARNSSPSASDAVLAKDSAPRVHGELLRLGIDVSERTVSRLMPKRRPLPSQTWRTFLANHVRD